MIIALPNVVLGQDIYLKKSWKKQVFSATKKNYEFNYRQNINNVHHSFKPWDISTLKNGGTLLVNNKVFFKSDTLYYSDEYKVVSKTNLSDNSLSVGINGKSKEVNDVIYFSEFINTAKYFPHFILDIFYKEKLVSNSKSDSKTATYSLKKQNTEINLYIDKTSFLVQKIEITSNNYLDDELYGFGDVRNEYFYDNYQKIDKKFIAKRVFINKLNGKLKDTLDMNYSVSHKVILDTVKRLNIEKYNGIEPDITIEEFRDNIHLINFHHAGTRSLLVEFSNYLCLIDAPLNSENGELLKNEIKKMIPNKPIKYFSFGHFHPHYTGGIRPFIADNAEIICPNNLKDYINYIANSSYRLKPDELENSPKEVKFQLISDELTIKDEKTEMRIINIGEKSKHTQDYLLFYFPKEKIIFQDDLVWINEKTTKQNLYPQTVGFYNAVKDLNLQIDVIIQNWKVFDKTKKMIYNFKDLEAIMNKE